MYRDIFKKILSFSLIFSLLFGTIFRIPTEIFLLSSFADDRDFYNLVSVIVDEESYSQTKSQIQRYARDVQNTLENTKVVILPTPQDARDYDIASLNESLYFEGYNALEDVDYESRLIGSVFV